MGSPLMALPDFLEAYHSTRHSAYVAPPPLRTNHGLYVRCGMWYKTINNQQPTAND